MIDVLIGLDKVLVIYVAIFVVIFCNWRCTLHNVSNVNDKMDRGSRTCVCANTFDVGVAHAGRKGEITSSRRGKNLQ